MKLMEPETSSLALRWAGNWDQLHPMAIIIVFPRPSIPKAGPLEPKCFTLSAVFSFVCQEHFEPIGERWFSSLSTAERSAFNQVELWAKREYSSIKHGNRFSNAKLRQWKTDTLHFRKFRRVILYKQFALQNIKDNIVLQNVFILFESESIIFPVDGT